VGPIISRDCSAFIFKLQAILCLHLEDEGNQIPQNVELL